MNEQSSKKILFNKSTLLSLKAELLRKQEEVLEKKHLPNHNLDLFKPHQATEKKNKSETNSEKRSLKDNLKAVDVEEFEACRKAKLALEKKAELYKHLEDGAGDSELAGRFLVNFKGKKQEVVEKPEPEPEPEEEQAPYEEDQGEWVEFTDFLGRTRKCLKSDLEHYKQRDEQLMRVVTNSQNPQDPPESEAQPQVTEKPLLVQTTNDYLQTLREKWEQQERELLSKDKDIHYQDLLFDEARIHGVGYYAFSTDEAERRKQMEELLKRRDETLKAQKQAEELRRKRDELVAARVAAARARQRARAGLPPEDPEEKKKEFTTHLLQFLTQQKDEADKKAKEEERKAKEEQEKERQKLREAYVREWDLGKEGVEDKVKKFREMTQEEYVEQQRAKRIDEFAPLQAKNSDNSSYVFDKQGRRVEPMDDDNDKTKTWADVRRVKTPPPPVIGDLTDMEQKGLYFSTKKTETVVKYKNFVKAQEPVPINNELSDEDDDINTRYKLVMRNNSSEYVEIEPPATYDYYGPTPKHRKTDKPFNSDIREAMAQGNKSLERKESNRRLPQHYDFTFD